MARSKRAGNGSARPWPTPASSSPSAGSPSTWPPPTFARMARRSTCPSPWASWSRAARSQASASPTRSSSARWGSRATCAPSVVPSPWRSRRARPVVPPSWCPQDNLPEAAVVAGLEVRGARTLQQVCDHLTGAECPAAGPVGRGRRSWPSAAADAVDFGEVRGQAAAKRALEVAAAGGHNILLDRPARCGQDHARPAPAHHPSVHDARGVARNHQDPQRRRDASGRAIALHGAAVSRSRITPSAMRAWSAAAPIHARERSAWRTAACFSSTSCRSSAGTSSRCCASRWKTPSSP